MMVTIPIIKICAVPAYKFYNNIIRSIVWSFVWGFVYQFVW
jgi:hypothetical protein